uniref:Uncharacterized protein n=1 Tax=Leptobrachium leishanense TaxID=445787 RepID=A0A8C5M5H9_9ANUR
MDTKNDEQRRAQANPNGKGIVKSLLFRMTRIWPLKYMFNILKKIGSFAGFSEVENIGATGPNSPRVRRFVSGRKRIGRLTRIILYFTPHRLQCALGYHSNESIGQASGLEDIKKSPLKPCGKGSKRKQDDLDLEEQHSWVTFMNEDLPDDEPDDPTYEPSNSDTDSEEQHSKNDTESDIEIEERDGVTMLKESIDKEDHLSTQKQINDDEQTCNGEQSPNKDGPNAGEQESTPTAGAPETLR